MPGRGDLSPEECCNQIYIFYMAPIALAAAAANDPNRRDEEDLGGYSAGNAASSTALSHAGRWGI